MKSALRTCRDTPAEAGLQQELGLFQAQQPCRAPEGAQVLACAVVLRKRPPSRSLFLVWSEKLGGGGGGGGRGRGKKNGKGVRLLFLIVAKKGFTMKETSYPVVVSLAKRVGSFYQRSLKKMRPPFNFVAHGLLEK